MSSSYKSDSKDVISTDSFVAKLYDECSLAELVESVSISNPILAHHNSTFTRI